MEKEKDLTKREIYGEILKDQYLTNAELLFNDLIGGTDYLIKEINKSQTEKLQNNNEQEYYEELAKQNEEYESMKSKVCSPSSTSVIIDCDKNEIRETKKDLKTGENKDTIVHFRNCLIKECRYNANGLCSRKDIIDGLTQCDFDNSYLQFSPKEGK